ncbi:MAG: tRNA modification GTPase [Oligoflexia bacterium]
MEKRNRPEQSSYLREETIASPITASGGAVTAIRVSGTRAQAVLTSLCDDAESILSRPRQLRLTGLHDLAGRKIDQCLAVFFEQGFSFTGEASFELFLHGGGLIQSQAMKALLEVGCKAALPGEFSFRAVKNGKMTLDQAEAVRDLIEATNETAHELALDRLGGSSARLFEEYAEILRQTLTLAEAGIDFSDQDLDEVSIARLTQRLPQVVEFLSRTEATLERGRRIQEGLHIALAGLPNAGKSTLFNELLGADRSLVSDEAGTTRDIIRERIRLRSPQGDQDWTLWLHDTAGLRSNTGRVEGLGIERALQAAREADLVLFVVDPTMDLLVARDEWRRTGSPVSKTLVVFHKADLEPDAVARRALEDRWHHETGCKVECWVSSKTQEGFPLFLNRLSERCNYLTAIEPGQWALTRLEQQDAVRQAREALERALSAEGHDLLAADLRNALEHLSFFIGKTSAEDVLGRIFSQFCIGK